jgi:hypothetical protein
MQLIGRPESLSKATHLTTHSEAPQNMARPESSNWVQVNTESESALENSRLQPWKEIVERIKSKDPADEQNHDGAL